ncbi:hypothetical protein BZA77DRAFT_150263 [Pyronema omphalodes]|nr:hypothetical protein BZA77DRAFT_150263 [Pyronema omphalodes]
MTDRIIINVSPSKCITSNSTIDSQFARRMMALNNDTRLNKRTRRPMLLLPPRRQSRQAPLSIRSFHSHYLYKQTTIYRRQLQPPLPFHCKCYQHPQNLYSHQGAPSITASQATFLPNPQTFAPDNAPQRTHTGPTLPPYPYSHFYTNRMSGPPIIDLTGSSPPPRPSTRPAPHEVIDIDDLPDPLPARNAAGDEVQLLYSRPGPHRRGRFGNRELPHPPRNLASLGSLLAPPRSRALPEDPILGNGGRIGQRSEDTGVNRNYYYSTPPPPAPHQNNYHQRAPASGHRMYINVGVNGMAMGFGGVISMHGFRAPGLLDYSQQAPGIFEPQTPPGDTARRRQLEYKKPPPPRPGFTRSPKETDILVCAQCDQELGVECVEDPKASEVWTGKCGHCYCGRCAMIFRGLVGGPIQEVGKKRPRPKSGKKICVISGCSNVLTAKMGMIKIHL